MKRRYFVLAFVLAAVLLTPYAVNKAYAQAPPSFYSVYSASPPTPIPTEQKAEAEEEEGDFDNPKGEVLLDPSDLYFYEDGKKVPLGLSPEIIVRFYEETSDEEVKSFVQSIGEFVPVARYEKNIRFGSYAIEVSLMPIDNQGELAEQVVDIVTFVMESGIAEASPVFLVENQRTVIRGVVIEPKTQISIPFMEHELERLYGDVSVKQFVGDGLKWKVFFKTLFFFPEAKMPLNFVSLANFLNTAGEEAPWVQSVTPYFTFLDNAITATMSVEPITGTIGEERTLTLTVKIYDDSIFLNKNYLPEFGFENGDFVPLSGNRPPLGSFFEVLGKRVVEERRSRFGRIVELKWRFMLFAPKSEWELMPQILAYLKGDEEKEISARGTTFFVMPHLEAGAEIVRFPNAPELKVPDLAFDGKVQVAPGESPNSTLSKFLATVTSVATSKDYERITEVMWAGTILLAILAILFAAALVRGSAFWKHGISPVENPLEDVIEIRTRYESAKSLPHQDFLQFVRESLRKILLTVEPNLPETLSISVLKDIQEKSPGLRKALDGQNGKNISQMFKDMDTVFAEHFEYTSEWRNGLLDTLEELVTNFTREVEHGNA